MYSLLGEEDQALDLIEKAVRNGYGHKEWLENDPDFTSLRDHPHFQALAATLIRCQHQIYALRSRRQKNNRKK